MKNRYSPLLLLCSFFYAVSATAQQPSVYYQSFITGLSAPVEVVNAGDGTARLFIVQQNGIIRVYDPAAGGLQATPFLDMSAVVRNNGEQGLLSAAFHPAFETNGYFFVYYNNLSGDITVARYSATGTSNTANAGSGVVLLNIAKPFDNHNGGHLQFAQDGTLYFATGDGGSGNDPFNLAQNKHSLLGKMLRLNVDNFTTPPYYTVPSNNPFVGDAAYDARIWALGLRNPFRWSFDRLTGDMWIGDVGQGAKEEVNYVAAANSAARNYGWRYYEGSISTPGVPDSAEPLNYVPPVFEYDNPSSGPSSVVGGYVYRGSEYPSLNNYYIAADVYSGDVYLLRPNGGGGFNSWTVTGLQNFIVGFGEAENGTLYAVGQGTGTVYKVVPSGTLPVSLQSFTGIRNGPANNLRWATASERAVSKFIVEWSTNGRDYRPAGEVVATNNPGGSSYSFNHTTTESGALYYRLKVAESNGSFNYSPVIKLDKKGSSFNLYPTIVRDGRFTINSSETVNEVQVSNAIGTVVYRKAFTAATGLLTVQLPTVAKGLYVVRITGTETRTEKIVVE